MVLSSPINHHVHAQRTATTAAIQNQSVIFLCLHEKHLLLIYFAKRPLFFGFFALPWRVLCRIGSVLSVAGTCWGKF